MKIGVLESDTKFIEIEIIGDKTESYKTDPMEIEQSDIQVLFYGSDAEDKLTNLLAKLGTRYPTIPLDKANVTSGELVNFPAHELSTLSNRFINAWSLAHNLELISHQFEKVSQLKLLWNTNRSDFFEEFWFLLKQNLATQDLTIIFHELKEKSNKNELYFATVKGSVTHQIAEATQIEKDIINTYSKELSTGLCVLEADFTKNQLVMGAKVKLSPILIMAKCSQLTALQRSILNSVINAISAED